MYKINYDSIIKDKRLLKITKHVAEWLRDNPYLTVEMFLEQISDDDIDTLLIASEDPDSFHYMEIGLLGEMLARAEGVFSESDDDLASRLSQLTVFLAAEGLARKGLIDISRENMSFGEDMVNAVFARALKKTD